MYGEKPDAPTGSALVLVNPDEVYPRTPEAQAPLHAATLMTREQLVDKYGTAIGESLYQVVQQDRQKAAAEFRAKQVRLHEIKQAIAAMQAKVDARLLELQNAADQAYDVYLQASASLEAARVQLQSEIAPLAHEAEAILGELNRPLHAEQVRQWAAWRDERTPPRGP
jgi:hypothetical protein